MLFVSDASTRGVEGSSKGGRRKRQKRLQNPFELAACSTPGEMYKGATAEGGRTGELVARGMLTSSSDGELTGAVAKESN